MALPVETGKRDEPVQVRMYVRMVRPLHLLVDGTFFSCCIFDQDVKLLKTAQAVISNFLTA